MSTIRAAPTLLFIVTRPDMPSLTEPIIFCLCSSPAEMKEALRGQKNETPFVPRKHLKMS